MKITIVTESFIGYMSNQTSGDIFGGQEILLYRTCKVLMEAGHDVVVIQFGKERKDFFYEDIRIIQVKERKFRFLEKLGFVRRWTWASFFLNPYIEKDTDWVHFHNHHFSFPHSLWLKKYILTGMNHGVEWDLPWVYSKLSLRNLKERFSFILLRAVTRFSVRNLNKIYTNDLFFIHYTTLKKPQLQNKFVYIPNFVRESFKPDVQPHKIISEKFKNKKILLLPKMPMKERGTDIMFDIMVDLKDKGFVLVITSTSSGAPYWIKECEKMNLNDCVYFTGHMSTDDLISVYAASDIVVIPSPCREATAITMLETMAMKKPLVLSNIGGLPEVGRNGYNCLLRNANKKEFMQAILELDSNPNLANEISQNGYDYVTKAFNTKIWDKAILNFFTK
tara:strand:+ start:31785 stop:32960 length:1176 start_codon:yes stop_codon:yes gene_type:complete